MRQASAKRYYSSCKSSIKRRRLNGHPIAPMSYSDWYENRRTSKGESYCSQIGNTFPTADVEHYVVQPATTYMCMLLTSCSVQTPTHAANGLLFVEARCPRHSYQQQKSMQLLLHYVHRNKRYVAELLTFLSSVLRAAVPEDAVDWRWGHKCPNATFTNDSNVLVVQVQEAVRDICIKHIIARRLQEKAITVSTEEVFRRLQSLQCQNADRALSHTEQRTKA